jgi:hypothetical protein
MRPGSSEHYLRIQSVPQRIRFSIIKVRWLMLSKKIVVAYIKNDTKLINTQCRFTGCQSG